MDIIRKKIPGSSLLEAITAMAIIAAVMGTAFTLYAKVVQSQKAVLKVRAAALVNTISFSTKEEQAAYDNDYYAAELTEETYGNAIVNQRTIHITDKTGKTIKRSTELITSQ